MVRTAPRAAVAAAVVLLAVVGAGCSKSESPPATTSTTAAASSTTKAGSSGTGAVAGAVSKADFVASLQDSGLGPEVTDCIVAQFDQAEVAYPPASGGDDEQEQLLDSATNDCVQDVIDASGDAGGGGAEVP